jgi:protein NUD1
LEKNFIQEPCYNLIYLEVAACRLTTLQADLALMMPNLRVLNLNYNFIEDTQPLEGLSRLRKLTLIGSRVKGAKSLVRLAQRISGAEVLDFR